ncbi:MAG: FAD-dependent oxidoreductase [Candidatus Andersenbacteria bacterium]|nr:FAD-dependent oxidoreductase [Candidatus Andersenbacteria bacterium]MBI3250384.1 FAD-dependent oxidoreductase [Candidatus Andersenbacteria bacterium]
MDNKEYDITIVGYGPAGITAAIYAARKRLSVALIGELPGGEVRNSGDIENWPGDGATDGNTLADKLIAHLKTHLDAVTIFQEKVTKVEKAKNGFTTTTESGKTLASKTIIYTAGRHPRLLNVPGEVEFKNRGVSYCATCDAPLFPDKDVVVIGGGNTGAEAVIMFQKIARKIYLLHNTDKLAADPILVDNFKDDPKVTIIYNTKTTKIKGKGMVASLTYENSNGKEETIPVEGVFVTIGAIPNTAPVKELIPLNPLGAIPADRYGITSIPGFFTAGDVTDIRDAQIVVAAGHGCSAALSAGDYISRLQ